MFVDKATQLPTYTIGQVGLQGSTCFLLKAHLAGEASYAQAAGIWQMQADIHRQYPPSRSFFIHTVCPPGNQCMQIPIISNFFPASQQKSNQQATFTLINY